MMFSQNKIHFELVSLATKLYKFIVSKNKNYKDFQVGYIAVNKKGEIGYYSIHEGFSATCYCADQNRNYPSPYFNKS